MKFLNKKGSGNPIWALISFILSVVIILALLRTLGIEITFVDYILSGIESFKEIIDELGAKL